jgi:hypothetical protein
MPKTGIMTIIAHIRCLLCDATCYVFRIYIMLFTQLTEYLSVRNPVTLHNNGRWI